MDAALRDELVSGFRNADVDHNGYIDKTELKEILNKQGKQALNQEQLTYAFKLFDNNDDGKIHLNEFIKGFLDLFS